MPGAGGREGLREVVREGTRPMVVEKGRGREGGEGGVRGEGIEDEDVSARGGWGKRGGGG